MSLAEARERARQQRQLILDGKDPLAVKAEAVAAAQSKPPAPRPLPNVLPTFSNAAHEAVQERQAPAAMALTLQAAVNSFGSLPMRQITSAVVLYCLTPIMKQDARNRDEAARPDREGFRMGAAHRVFRRHNPATREALKDHLPESRRCSTTRRCPMPICRLSWRADRERDRISAKALEFTILTAARTAETIGAKWSEIDLRRRPGRSPPTG